MKSAPKFLDRLRQETLVKDADLERHMENATLKYEKIRTDALLDVSNWSYFSCVDLFMFNKHDLFDLTGSEEFKQLAEKVFDCTIERVSPCTGGNNGFIVRFEPEQELNDEEPQCGHFDANGFKAIVLKAVERELDTKAFKKIIIDAVEHEIDTMVSKNDGKPVMMVFESENGTNHEDKKQRVD